MLDLVESGLYFVPDENNFIYPLLKVGSGSGGPKINGYDRIRIPRAKINGTGSSSLLFWFSPMKVLTYGLLGPA